LSHGIRLLLALLLAILLFLLDLCVRCWAKLHIASRWLVSEEDEGPVVAPRNYDGRLVEEVDLLWQLLASQYAASTCLVDVVNILSSRGSGG
jgi:hypothetical protein